jgi:hypothetical protein
MSEAGHVEFMGEITGAYSVLVGKRDATDHLEDIQIDGRKILKCIIKN